MALARCASDFINWLRQFHINFAMRRPLYISSPDTGAATINYSRRLNSCLRGTTTIKAYAAGGALFFASLLARRCYFWSDRHDDQVSIYRRPSIQQLLPTRSVGQSGAVTNAWPSAHGPRPAFLHTAEPHTTSPLGKVLASLRFKGGRFSEWGASPQQGSFFRSRELPHAGTGGGTILKNFQKMPDPTCAQLPYMQVSSTTQILRRVWA